MIRKRMFDLTLTLLAAVLWVPLLFACALSVLIFSGWPILYISRRRVYRSSSIRVLKLRTMVRNADKVANRETVPVNGVRFLNIPPDSPLYTRIGRIIEQFHLTELPQLFHVLTGHMSLVGNRPLPENVISSLKEEFPWAEDRFLTKAGLTGPVQLVGRESISDKDRLMLEVAYCKGSMRSYSARLDFVILLYTVLIALRIITPRSVSDTMKLLTRFFGPLDSALPEQVPCDIVNTRKNQDPVLLESLGRALPGRPAPAPHLTRGRQS